MKHSHKSAEAKLSDLRLNLVDARATVNGKANVN